LVFGISGFSQVNSYELEAGKEYWKKRKPFEGYWQQDVHYNIKASIDDAEETVAGYETLVYYNNSPDTLYTIYFHLYQNAFTPNSYAHNLAKSGKIAVTFGENEAKGIGTEIRSFKIGGENIPFTIDNTILIVKLQKPIYPNTSEKFDVEFITYWDKNDGGNMRRRMKTFEQDGITHFDGVHWYPRICVYDRKFGWTTDQHLGKEFYGDFGLFEVELTFPNQYIVEATGELQNEEEVLPPALRKVLDISNYRLQKDEISQPIKADGTKKTWKYKAINVHDFAFTADPTYRIGEVTWNGIRCIALAQEQNAHRWQQTATYVAKLIELYSTEIGQFGYPKMVAADARDGMEYPMLTLNSGNWPGHQYVIAHEVGHNWFFGMVGNNETYAAGLDEGFTQWLTALSLKKLSNQDFYNNNIDKAVVFNNYMYHAVGDNNARLNIHSDHFNSAERHGGGYGQVYHKTATMLYNLQYVLGDELFKESVQAYFEQWKYGHPYWEDFRNAIIHYTKADLNWFFDYWLTTTNVIDYKVGKVKYNENATTITLHRKTQMQMPLDVEVVFKNGEKEHFYIPNTYFQKQTNAQVGDKWTGWDSWNTSYDLAIIGNRKIRNVIIDPSGRLADINRLNNAKKIPLSRSYASFKQPYEDYSKYTLYWHPNLWYNGIDGLKLGLDINGHYYANKHVFNSTLFANTGVFNRDNSTPSRLLGYKLSYSHLIKDNLTGKLDSRLLDGLSLHQIGLTKKQNRLTYSISIKSMIRPLSNDINYLIYENLWQHGEYNNTLNIGLHKALSVRNGNASWNIKSRASYLFSDYNYAFLNTELLRNFDWKKLGFRARLFGQIGNGNFAPESRLMLAGASNEELMENAFSRSIGFIPQEWEGYGSKFNHFHYGGGLNLRGYSGYAATTGDASSPKLVYAGESGASVNTEIEFIRNLKLVKKWDGLGINSYVFGDAGWLYYSGVHSGLRTDAGIGILSNIYFSKYNVIKPVAFRIDFPLFVNRIPYSEPNYFTLRYIVGISRAF
jgi:aminopeptidase N